MRGIRRREMANRDSPGLSEETTRDLKTRLEAIVRRICPPWISSQADDIVQNAILRLIGRLESEENRSLNSSYLWKTAYSTLVDEIRLQKRHRQDVVSEAGAEMIRSPIPDPERCAANEELAGVIRNCLRTLASDRRCAVTLRLLGHTVPEIAKLLKWTGKRAENLVYRGFADLRRCLQSKGFSP